MAHSVRIIDRHLECAIQTELVVKPDIPLIRSKQSGRFKCNSVICQKDTKAFTYVGTVLRSKVV